jgi:hypothetical protein
MMTISVWRMSVCDSENLDMRIYMVGEIEWRDDEKGAESVRPWDGLATRVDVEVEGESCGVGELEDVVLSLKGRKKWSSRRNIFLATQNTLLS